MFQDISQSLVLIAFVWGPLVYAREHNGTHVTPYIHKGGPWICQQNSAFVKCICTKILEDLICLMSRIISHHEAFPQDSGSTES